MPQRLGGALSRSRRLDVAYAAAAMALTSLVTAWVLELWSWRLQVPLTTPEGDGGHVLALVQSMLRNGWFLSNPDLGAPAGQEFRDYAGYNGDVLHFALMKVLGLFSEDAAPVVNVYFLLAFSLCALSSFLVMRWVGISRPAALVCAVLFAVAPYHFLRGEPHLFLGAYYLVPVTAYLVLAVYADEPLLQGRRRALLTIGLGVLAALAGLYYAVFAILLVVAAGLLTYVAKRSKRALASAAVLVAVMGATVALEMTPTILHRLDHGTNDAVGQREAAESFEYATGLTDLLLPTPGHRVHALDALEERFRQTVPIGHEVADRLGLVAAAGFLWLLGLGVVMVVRGSGRFGRDARQGHLVAAAATAFLIGTAGGVSGLIAYLVSPQVRSWNRISIFIALFALIAVGLLLDRLRNRLRRPALGVVVLGTVLVVGVLDQTNVSFVPDHDALAAQWRSDGEFVSRIEDRLPEGAMVLQLPYVSYPEHGPVERIPDYAHIRAYLHSGSLRWSYGSMRGRADDWLAALADAPLSTVVDRARELGFRGVYVDRHGYGDKGAAVEAELGELLEEQPMVSADRRLSFFAMPARPGTAPPTARAGSGPR